MATADARAGELNPTLPTPVELVSQRRLLGLAPGSPVQVNKLGRVLEHRSWVRSVDRTDTGLNVSIKDGPIASLRIELAPSDPHGSASLLAMDGIVRGKPSWLALLPDLLPGAPLGLDSAGHTVWSISPRVAIATEQDDQGVMYPVTIDAGSLDLSTRMGDLDAAFNQALQAGQEEIIEQEMVDLTPFGSCIVLDHRARWQDRRAELCGAPLSALVEQSLGSQGLAQRRAGRDALRHTLAACMEGGQPLSWALPLLHALVDGWLGQVEPDLSAPPYTTARLQDLVQALRTHPGTGAKPFDERRWDRADWPARVALLVNLKQSLSASGSVRRPALESIYAKARQQLRRQLVSVRDRAMADGRIATGELAQAVLVRMVGQPPAHLRPLSAEDAVATWIRGALLAPVNRPDAPSLLEAALADNRLALVGLTLPKVSVLLADPRLGWGPVALGAVQANIGGPTVQLQTLMHAWSPSATVPNPAWQAAQAEARYLDEAIDAIDGVELSRIEQLEQRRTGISLRPLALGPGHLAPGHELESWRAARLSSLRAHRNAIEALSPTTGRRRTSLVGFQAQVQRWSGTVSRTLHLALPSGTYQHQSSVDVSAWRYLRNRGNPRVELPRRDQFVDRSEVVARAQAELDAHLSGDLAALLGVGIRARTWDQAMALGGNIADRSREAAALLWLLTGQEAPDLLGIGSVEGLAPGGPRGIPGDALLVRVSPDGERAVLLRDPYTYEVFDVDTGLRLFGPEQLEHRVHVVDGATDDLSFRPDGRVLRIADALVDLDTGSRLRHEAAWPATARPVGFDPAHFSQILHRGQAMLQVGRALDPGSTRTVALPQPPGDTWVLDHGFASPELGHAAVQLRGVGGNTAVVVLSLEDGSIVQSWTQGSPRLANTPDGIAVTTLAGLQLARWSARGVDLRAVALRPDSGLPFSGPVGIPVWGPAVTAEVFDHSAVLYGDNGAGGTAARIMSIPSGDRPELLDRGRVLLTHGRNRLYLTRLPTWIAAPR